LGQRNKPYAGQGWMHRLRKAVRPGLAPALAAVVLLGACDIAPTTTRPSTDAESTARSGESLRLEKYYASVQQRLVSQGLLRTDGGGADTPFGQAALVENFERIALYDEYAIVNGRFVAQQTPSRLRRWDRPIRIGLVFGAYVSDAQRAADRAEVVAYAKRLSRLTGVPISVSNNNANFHILFLHRDDTRTVGPQLQTQVPQINQVVMDEIANSPRNNFCVAYAFSDPKNDSAYSSAIILIKAEHQPLMRRSCIHEEMAQAMGLANDSPKARPSIFNDDEEFALLTHHDEVLLKMLYDTRLRIGMTPAEARPILPRVAANALGGS